MRHVEPIVDADTWAQAQQVLKEHTIIAVGARVRQYGLQGLIKCSLCGLTYIGTGYPQHGGGSKAYDVCSGKHTSRQLLRPPGGNVSIESDQR